MEDRLTTQWQSSKENKREFNKYDIEIESRQVE